MDKETRELIQTELDQVAVYAPPGWADRVIAAMASEALIADAYIGYNLDCGCFYGHAALLSEEGAITLVKRVIGHLIEKGIVSEKHAKYLIGAITPIEILLKKNAEYDENRDCELVQEHSPDIGELCTLLRPYCHKEVTP